MICEQCHEPYTPAQPANQKYCSGTCKNLAKWLRKKARQAAARGQPMMRCEHCSQLTPLRPNKRFCSRDCRNRWHREQAAQETEDARAALGIKCHTCGNPVRQNHTGTIKLYCDARCKSLSVQKNHRAKRSWVRKGARCRWTYTTPTGAKITLTGKVLKQYGAWITVNCGGSLHRLRWLECTPIEVLERRP